MDFNEIKAHYSEYRSLLSDYRERIKESRLWFKQQQTEYQSSHLKNANMPSSHSGHIFNAIQYKHADLMDNFPVANILPREQSDEESAKVLTDIVPFVLERCGFKRTYALNLYNKLISGTAVYGVFFNPAADGGRGEIEVKDIELLNLTWQPDAVSLEDSKFIFYDSFMALDDFVVLYGDHEGVQTQAQYDEQKDKSGLSGSDTVVITEAYYKKTAQDGKRILHYIKYSGEKILESSEQDAGNYPNGFYCHGKYPFVFDILNPVPGELTGMGIVDVAKDMQGYIDRLDEAINRKCLIAAQDRYFFQENSGVNEEEFLDVSRPLVHVRTNIDETHAKPINVNALPQYIIEHRNDKISELKEITGNRDFAQGGSTGGVTSGSAITALQTASDKLVRDSVTFSYIAFEEIVRLMIELIREFYDEPRVFRITGDDGKNKFESVSSAALFSRGESSVFDISLTVEKNNPYQRAMHNQLILELNGNGLLNPDNFEVCAFILKNLNFDGKEKLLQDLEELCEKRKQTAANQKTLGAGVGGGVPAAEGIPAGAIAENGGAPLVEIPLSDSAMSGGSQNLAASTDCGSPLVEIPID